MTRWAVALILAVSCGCCHIATAPVQTRPARPLPLPTWTPPRAILPERPESFEPVPACTWAVVHQQTMCVVVG